MSIVSEKLVAAFDTRLKKARRNMLPYATVSGGTVTLDPGTSVYRATATGGVFPTVDLSGLPEIHSYYCFELEVSVPSGATLDASSVSGWTWLDGGSLPTTGYAGRTIFVAARADCITGDVTAYCYGVR